jgi:GNAT superfamily N-acetyltransferase
MTEQILVRRAADRDHANITRLFVQLKDHHRELQPTNPRYDVETDLWGEIAQTALQDPELHVFVAEIDGLVVGFMKIHFEVKPWGLSCELDTMVVDEQRRGRGVGKRLLEELEDFARNNGAAGIRVDVLIPNYEGREFYERGGYEAFAVRYGKPVRD